MFDFCHVYWWYVVEAIFFSGSQDPIYSKGQFKSSEQLDAGHFDMYCKNIGEKVIGFS